MRPDVARHLRCPLCGHPFDVIGPADDDPGLRCALGHRFDRARQGYVNLLLGRGPDGVDTPDMVAARADLLGSGHFSFLTEALAGVATELVASVDGGLVVDVGAGTGHYLAAVLDALDRHVGLALDLAKPAARRAGRAHPRAEAAVCDVWRGLPLADGCADLILDVFAPRNGPEFRRVLSGDGALIVVTPRPDHLAELVPALGLIRIDPDKDRRLEATLGQAFRLARQIEYAQPLALSRIDAGRLVAMGPNAWHTETDRLTARLADLAEPIAVTASVTLRVYRHQDHRAHMPGGGEIASTRTTSS